MENVGLESSGKKISTGLKMLGWKSGHCSGRVEIVQE